MAAASAVAVPTPLQLVSAKAETGHVCQPPAPLAAKYPVSCRRCPPHLRASCFERPVISKISNLGAAVVFRQCAAVTANHRQSVIAMPAGKDHRVDARRNGVGPSEGATAPLAAPARPNA